MLYAFLSSMLVNAATTRSGTWHQNEKGWWYVFSDDGTYAKSMWITYKGVDYYFLSDGYMATSQYVDGKWVKEDGAWVTTRVNGKWHKNSRGWWYSDDSGKYATGWTTIQFKQYYFDSAGYCVLNQWIGDKYVDTNGVYIPGAKKLQGVTITSTINPITIWDTMTLKVATSPKGIPADDLVWTSRSENVATVDSKGVVQGRSAGTAKITVSSKYPEGASQTVTVQVVAVKGSATALELKYGECEKAKVNWNTDKIVMEKWESKNPSIAEVSNVGIVRAVGIGSTDIIVRAYGPNGATATCSIRVSVLPVVKFKDRALSLTDIDTKNPELVNESHYSENLLQWKSDDPSIVEVVGGTLIPHNYGTTKISITGDYKISDSIPVTVTKAITMDDKLSMVVGDEIDVPFKPVSDNIANYAVYSKNPQVVSVSYGNKLKAESRGDTDVVITVTGKSGISVEYPVRITVTSIDNSFDNIILRNPKGGNSDTYEMTIGDTADFTVEMYKMGNLSVTLGYDHPTERTDQGIARVTWELNDTADPCCSVENGRVTAKDVGSVQLNVYIDQTTLKKSVIITVKRKPVLLQSMQISFSPSDVKDGSVDLIKQYMPKEAEDKDSVVWKSDDPGVATVVAGGRVTLWSPGITTIRAYSSSSQTELGSCTVWKEGWVQDSGNTQYVDFSGGYAKGWRRIENNWYYFGTDTCLVKGLKNIDGSWYYLNADTGVRQTGICYVGGKYYLFDSNGVMQTGWKRIDKNWYYFDSKGVMQTGWKKIKKWYYFDSKGVMQTGWKKLNKKWYYLGQDGVMRTGWKKLNKKWYYFGKDGVMRTGWVKIDKKWYYFVDGAMKTGWLKYNRNWYYMKASGEMATGTVKIGSAKYRFNSSGIWIP